jgi:hypothetical protein
VYAPVKFVPVAQGRVERPSPLGDGRIQEQDGDRNNAHEPLQDDQRLILIFANERTPAAGRPPDGDGGRDNNARGRSFGAESECNQQKKRK